LRPSRHVGGGPRGHSLSGTLYAGTSGFSYRDWAPRFYPAGIRAAALLGAYAQRLTSVELNGTFHRRPSPEAVAGWVAATAPEFRFVVKAQRGAAVRALLGSPDESVEWLTAPLGGFGDRLGAVLWRVPAPIRRGGPAFGGDPAASDRQLAALLAAWPARIPLVLEFQEPSWHVDETFDLLRAAGATLCTTELPDDIEAPTIRRTGRLLYLRLRRLDYDEAELERWADRVVPFLEAGDDAYAFFRHDAVGRAGELALAFQARVAAKR
jgi:uncharacterized protein YecE (DUF72 family)